jgi:hypothetical protein
MLGRQPTTTTGLTLNNDPVLFRSCRNLPTACSSKKILSTGFLAAPAAQFHSRDCTTLTQRELLATPAGPKKLLWTRRGHRPELPMLALPWNRPRLAVVKLTSPATAKPRRRWLRDRSRSRLKVKGARQMLNLNLANELEMVERHILQSEMGNVPAPPYRKRREQWRGCDALPISTGGFRDLSRVAL